jgi:hypothetical protein
MNAARGLVAVVCAALLVSLVAPAAVAPAAATSVATPVPDDELGFEEPVSEQAAGDVVRLALAVPGGSTATLAVGGPGYEARADVVDADGDGRVVVRLNTFAAGWRATEAAAYEAAGADRVVRVVRESPRRAAPLAPGPYALSLSGPVSDSARLDLSGATFDAAAPFPAPRDAHPGDAAGVRRLSTPNRTVAAGDWAVVTFHASGLGGVARLDDPPASNLVYAVESAPGARSTHVVRRPLAANASPASLRLDYDAGDGGVPGGLDRLAPDRIAVGYDTDADGGIDVDLAGAVSNVSVDAGNVSVTLADVPAAAAGDALVVRLPVTNPARSGTDGVALTVDGRRTVGEVEYGLAGSGALGNGLDLRLAPVGADGSAGTARPVSPAVHEVIHDPRRDALSVVVDTRRLDRGSYAATLALTPANPTVSRPRTLTAGFDVVDRRVTLVRPAPDAATEAGALPVAVTTTLAPGTDLRLHVAATADPAALAVRTLTVDRNGTASTTVELGPRLAGAPVRVVVREGGRVVAGPRVVRQA